jgi:hypothetical protein
VAEKRHTPDKHARNFIDCVHSQRAPSAEIGMGHVSSLHAHLGNISARTGRALGSMRRRKPL